MSSILHSMINNYDVVLHSTKDPEVDSWIFMSSPVPVLSILAAYLYFVLKLGPQWMSSRKPYNIQKFLVSYNLYQVVFSMWLCSVPIRLGAIHYLIASACQRNLTNQSYYAKELSTGAWWYFVSKIVDLLDTVFFVLRKKQEQVTFLHVYHHTITCLFSWGYLKYLPGEQGVVIAFLNSGVHVFMYTYYMIAAMGPKYTKYLWWKKYLTWIQLVQFCLMLTYLLTLLVLDCQFPKALTFFFVGNVIIFLFLFARFYKKAYRESNDLALCLQSFSLGMVILLFGASFSSIGIFSICNIPECSKQGSCRDFSTEINCKRFKRTSRLATGPSDQSDSRKKLNVARVVGEQRRDHLTNHNRGKL